MDEPRVHEVELFVTEVERSLRVYRDIIGLPLGGHVHNEGDETHFHASWGVWGEGEDGGFMMFSIYRAEPGEETRAAVGFTVKDLDSIHDALKRAGVKVLQEPQSRPWGQSANYLDADGNRITLTVEPAS